MLSSHITRLRRFSLSCMLPASVAVAACTPDYPPAAQSSPTTIQPAQQQATESAAEPLPAADTVAAAAIQVGGQSLYLSRQALRRRLGAPDSTFSHYSDDLAACLPGTDSVAVFERYRGLLYLRDGDKLRFMQTVRPPLRVQLPGLLVTEQTTLLELQRAFPASAQTVLPASAGEPQRLEVYRPAAETNGDVEWYEFLLQDGRVVQFSFRYDCS